MRPLLTLLALGLALAGCATHQVRFQPAQGLGPEAQPALARGEFPVAKDRLFDAAATTLEHEPYLHWDITLLDRANGLIKASAGLLREVQIRVTALDAPAGASATAGSLLALSVPRRELKTHAKVYIKRQDPAFRTAYEPAAAEAADYRVVSADVELDDAYFRSFTWRVLNDRSQVPFRLQAYGPAEDLGQAPGPTPEQALDAAPSKPVPIDEGPRLPVREPATGPQPLSPAARP